MAPAIVIADTSVLVNFLSIDRMDLIGAHPDMFITTEHVSAEIVDSYPDQQARYRVARYAGHLVEQRVDDPAEVELFLRLGRKQRLGAGERSVIAVAMNRNHRLAVDDNRAIRRAVREARVTGNPIQIVRTQDIIVQLIRHGVLTLAAAEVIRMDWAYNHRFRLKISSFADLL